MCSSSFGELFLSADGVVSGEAEVNEGVKGPVVSVVNTTKWAGFIYLIPSKTRD